MPWGELRARRPRETSTFAASGPVISDAVAAQELRLELGLDQA